MKKQTKNAHAPLEKALIWPGVALVVLGSIASIYYTYVNQRFFLQDNTPALLSVSYLNYFVILGGGFAIGYLLTQRSSTQKLSQLFNGVCYAFLTMALFEVWDSVRVLIRNISGGDPVYPWGMYLFSTGPLFALLFAVLIAFFFQYRANQTALSTKTKWIFVVSFLVYEAYLIGDQIYYVTARPAGVEIVAQPLWLAISGYLIQPLAVTVIAFITLWGGVKNWFQRLFYATFIGSFASILMLVLWNFQTDATMAAYDQFQILTTTIVIIVISILLWIAHASTKKS